MKKALVYVAMLSIFVSCSNDDKTTTETTKDVVGVSDSTVYNNNALADTARFTPEPVTPPVVTKTEKRVETSKASTPKTITKKTRSSVMTPVPVNTGTKTRTDSTVTTSTPVPAPEPAKKKGWSSAAKDAAIGGVGGAIGGAIISKKKGKGAIIGGVLGAAGGYIIGRKKDKKEQANDTIR